MPRQPARTPKPRRYCRTEFHHDAEEYLKDLADDVGVQVAYIIRLCVHRALPAVEEELRAVIADGRDLPPDELKRPTKPLKTALRRPRQTPRRSRLEPPPLVGFLETGEMPPEPLSLPTASEPAPSPEPKAGPQEPEPSVAPSADAVSPGSDQADADLMPTQDRLQQKLRKVVKMRRG